MYSRARILPWLEENVQGMRQSRRKTLATMVLAALCLQGVGVLALGRAMAGEVSAKHCIKRVWRFLRNDQVEVEAVFRAVLCAILPAQKRVPILADWTDRGTFQQLVFAVAKDGRAIPVVCVTVPKGTTKKRQQGTMIRGEAKALDILARIVPEGKEVVIMADRGFANQRWMTAIAQRGWYFVQRMKEDFMLDTDQHIGTFAELGVRRGWRPRDHGEGSVFDNEFGPIHAVSVFERDADEALYLITNLPTHNAKQLVSFYKKRMWIEAMFRDLKNRDWGLGADHVKLSTAARHTNHFLVLMLTYLFLCALGTIAEANGLAKELKANTAKERTLNLLRIGFYAKHRLRCSLNRAIKQLRALPS